MGARLHFAILGPLEVRRDGAVVGIGGPRQRALLALLLCSANRVLSRDRLIDELLADQPARSPDRMLRVQVSRLRKALADGDERPRLLSRPPGYVLRVEAGELDLDVFEQLVRDGRAALELDDPVRAAAALRDAESLWRGRPFADVEQGPFARLEARRLEELRLVAIEDRIEAELALGRHADLCAELTTLTSEYLLRERLRGQLMLALYRSGRQVEALAVYRQTGEMLREELGLDPSRALQELERSILLQEAALDGAPGRVAVVGSDQATICPFKGLEFFDRGDSEYFCGRERIVGELLARLSESSLVGIIGPSGIGKSSLLRAGVLAALSAGELPGSAGWRQLVVRPGEHPCRELSRSLGGEQLASVLAALAPGARLVVAVDQLEELFTTCERDEERVAFLEQLSDAACDRQRRVIVLVALRGDFYVRFASHPRFAALLSGGHVLIGPMERPELAQAIQQPAARVGLEVERGLLDALVSDAVAQSGGLPLLSAMLVELWQARDGRALRYESYRASGGMQAAVGRLAETAYERLEDQERRLARGVLVRLASEQDGAVVRRRAPVAELERIVGANPVVAALIDARLLTLSDGRIELSHEALLYEWPRFRAWLEEDGIGRRLQAHLTTAAAEWEAEGRDPGSLYRGARLAGALDWSVADGDRLNSLEREFLDRSRLESQREQRRQRAQNRRLRGLLLAVGVLLLVAVGAAIVARVKQQSASDAARAALGRQIGAQAINEPRLDLAMLMAREAINLDRAPQTEGSLLATLLRSPAVIGTIALPAGTTAAALAFSPDGRTLAVAAGLGELRLLDARTHAVMAAPLGGLSEVQPPAYSPDGSLLAYRSPGGCGCAFIEVSDTRTHQPVVDLPLQAATPPAPSEIPGGSIAIAGDDHTVYYAYWNAGRAASQPGAYLERWALPSGRALTPVRIGSQRLLAIRTIDSGSRLEIVSAREVEVFDRRSPRPLRAVAISPAPAAPTAAAISPDGRTVVIGSRDGAVSFVDASSGRVRLAAVRQSAPIASVVYARSAPTVATVGNDDTVIVWNPRSAGASQLLTGPAGQVAGAAISPDGNTLYTASQNGVLLEWDLTGERRFDDRATVGAALRCCDPVAPRAPPLAISHDGSTFAVRIAPRTVGLFSVGSLKRLSAFTIAASRDTITALAFSPSADELAVAGHDGLVQLWSTDGRPRLVRSLTGLGSMFGQSEAIEALAFSPDGTRLAASDDDQTGSIGGGAADDNDASLAIWDVDSGRPLVSRTGLSSGAIFQDVGDDLLAYSPDGKLLAVSLFDGSIAILDAATGTLRQAFASNGTTALAFAPNGALAVGTQAGTVKRFDPLTGKPIGAPLVVAATAVTSIAFERHGRLLATAGRGAGTVKLWLTAPLEQEGPALDTDPGATANVSFQPGGDRLLAVDDAGHVLTWPISLAAWEQRACAVAGHGFTRPEWSQLNVGEPYSAVCR